MSDQARVDLYERHARDYDHDRTRSLAEQDWLDRFLALVRPGGEILDIGCGMGEPIARYCMEAGVRVVGVDASPTLIALCRERFPGAEWIVADMRELALDRQFDGLLAWDSFFHLSGDDQREMFPRFAGHARPGAPLMFTSGTSEGVAMGSYRGEPLYHASLDPGDYRRLLVANGFAVEMYVPNDPSCGEHTVWLAVWKQGEVKEATDPR
jgi:cyclopropane fatty-acyl-phospholipid synthase-like methyltransferase